MAKTMIASEGITDGQIETLVNKVRDAARKHRDTMPKDAAQKALGVENLGMQMLAVFRQHAEATMFLAPRGTHTVSIGAQRDHDKFFVTRKGLWVYGDFRSRVVAGVASSLPGTTYSVARAELLRYLLDSEIETALGGNHLFEPTDLCDIIAELVSNQPEGKEGVLLNNGYANLFYTGSCVVDVRWRADDRKWHVNAWKRGVDRWYAVGQVFYRN